MSIAASLANLRRQGQAIPHNPPHVNLTQLSLKSSLADRAASARNALILLSAVDATLPSFENRLYLNETSFDRAVLPPDAQKTLATTITALTLRLSPVFLTRPCTAILEWLIQTLQLSTLGSTEEIDGIMLCVLPFHETEQFLLIARTLLRSSNAKKWRWLMKKAKAGTLIDASFCVAKAPLQIFRHIIARAIECVKHGVAVTPLAALITNFVGRRMASDDRPILTAICVDALVGMRSEENGSQQLTCALLVALSAALSHGLELPVAQTVARIAALLLTQSDASSDVAQTSTALLALLLRTHPRCLSPKDARMLLKADHITTALSHLGTEQSKETYRDIIIRAVSSGNPSEKHLRIITKAFEADHLLSSESISRLVDSILESCATEVGGNGKKFANERATLLASLFTALFKSTFSSTLDDTLHRHFTARKVERRDTTRFRLIDAAVSRAVDSITSKKSDSYTQEMAVESHPLAADILCLSHPDRKKRRKALESISRRELSEKENELKRLVKRLQSIIEFERDLSLVATALEIVMRLPAGFISPPLIGVVLVRSKSEYEKGTERTAERDKLACSLLEFCESVSDEYSLLASAILLVLSFEGLLECNRSSEGQDRLERLRKRYGISDKEKSLRGTDAGPLDVAGEIREGISHMILEQSNTFAEFFFMVAEVRQRWTRELSYSWLKVLFNQYTASGKREDFDHISNRILALINLHSNVPAEMIRLIEEDFESIVGSGKSPSDGAVLVWKVTSELASWECHERVLHVMIGHIGLIQTLKVLQDACVDSKNGLNGRKRSMGWYVNFCVVNSDVDVGKEAVETVSRITYGDDSNMRIALDEIWSRRSALNRKKREKKSSLWDFLQLLATLQERPSQMDVLDPISNLLCSELYDALRDSKFINLGKPPLRDASFDNAKRKMFEQQLGAKLLDLKRVESGDMYLLRALGCGYFTETNECRNLYNLLESSLYLVKEGSYSGFTTEALCRIALMILGSGKNPVGCLAEVKCLAKPLALAFRAVLSLSEPPDSALIVTLLCLMGHVISCTETKSFPEKDAIIDLLLASVVAPTITGSCASRIVELLAGDCIRQDYLLSLMRGLIPGRGPKSRKSHPGLLRAWGELEILSSEKAAFGAVKAVGQSLRNAIEKQKSVDLSWLLSSLTILWTFIHSVNKEHQDILSNAEGHGLEQLANVLKTITSLHRAISLHDARKGQDVATEADFDALIGVAFAEHKTDILANPLIQEVQKAAHELLEVLISCQDSEAIPVLPKLLESRTFAGQVHGIVKFLEGILPTVVKTETDAQDIAKIVADAAYQKSHQLSQIDRMKIMQTLATNCNEAIGSFSITKISLKELYFREHQISSPSASAKCCSAFLQYADLTCAEVIDCMIFMESEIDCRITCIHFVNSDFVAKLGTFAENSDLLNTSLIDDKLSKLFIALLGLKSSAERDLAVRLLLASMPLSAMQVCSLAALKSANIELRIAALHHLGDRFATHSLPLPPTWLSMTDESVASSKVRREVELQFLSAVGDMICESMELNGTKPEEIEIREVATDTLGSLAERLGSASFTVIQHFGSRISCLSTKDYVLIESLNNMPERGLFLRGKVLESLAIFTAKLARYSLPFVPHLLESSLAVLEEFCDSRRRAPPEPRDKDYNASVFVTAASHKALTAVLTSCPMFFGGKALKRLLSLELRTDVETPGKLLQHAAREVPVDVFVSVFGSFVTMDSQQLRDSSVGGLLGLVKGISSGVSRMYKSEIKVNWPKLLNLLLQTLDCARDLSLLIVEEDPQRSEIEAGGRVTPSRLLQGSFDDTLHRLEDCNQLDNACADVLVKMILKLSESEFEAVFKALLQWYDAGSLPESALVACEDEDKEVDKNVLRGLPFFGMMGKLLSVLKTIMIPYFVRVLSRLTATVGRKITIPFSAEGEDALPKKRRRAANGDSDTCSILLSQQVAVRETCLKLLESFFNLELKESVTNTRLVEDLQAALLSAFDDLKGEPSSVPAVLQGLAKRMIVPGIGTDAKKNQDMLIGLVREVLSRTRDPNARLRAGALHTCRGMAKAVGDEFLATLPESMPILAEVIDDEEPAVAKAATRYVLFLESIAGEPIMQQLT